MNNQHSNINQLLKLEEDKLYWQEKVNHFLKQALELKLKHECEAFNMQQKLNNQESQKKEIQIKNKSLEDELKIINEAVNQINHENEKHINHYKSNLQQYEELERKYHEKVEEVKLIT